MLSKRNKQLKWFVKVCFIDIFAKKEDKWI